MSVSTLLLVVLVLLLCLKSHMHALYQLHFDMRTQHNIFHSQVAVDEAKGVAVCSPTAVVVRAMRFNHADPCSV